MELVNRKKNLRLSNYNYSTTGYYFITICTYKKYEFFNNIEIKKIVEQHWQALPTHFNNIEIDEYIIMPNHIHGIIIILDKKRTRQALTLHINKRYQLLPVILGGFKSGVSRDIHKLGINFKWERSYYEHIIRNQKELDNIRKYINENPIKWNIDTENRYRSSKIDMEEYYTKIYKGII